ncbi:STAS domain-containing protein [Amycolatopsis sp. lyj-109]|uniref:STAS domain-containing protein n=1 Tax=Amycolatopsis sp. lyj-109 TaxID=2789287 RepID=UPI00397C6CDB
MADDGGGVLVEVVSTSTGDALILRLAGVVDPFGRDRIDYLMLAATEALRPLSLAVLDLSALELLGAAGARALARWMIACAERGITVRLVVAPRSTARRVVVVAGLDRRATVFDDLEPALHRG